MAFVTIQVPLLLFTPIAVSTFGFQSSCQLLCVFSHSVCLACCSITRMAGDNRRWLLGLASGTIGASLRHWPPLGAAIIRGNLPRPSVCTSLPKLSSSLLSSSLSRPSRSQFSVRPFLQGGSNKMKGKCCKGILQILFLLETTGL